MQHRLGVSTPWSLVCLSVLRWRGGPAQVGKAMVSTDTMRSEMQFGFDIAAVIRSGIGHVGCDLRQRG
jgi:hypothetical protein